MIGTWVGTRAPLALRQFTWARRALFGSALLFAASASLAGLDVLASTAMPTDLRAFYLAAAAAAEGRDFYDPSVLVALGDAVGLPHPIYPYLYSPVVAQSLQPFASLQPADAALCWAWCSVASTTVALVALSRPWQTTSDFSVLAALEGLLALFVLPFHNALGMGQINAFVVAMLALALTAHRTGRDVWAGTLVAMAALVKTSPVLFAVFLLVRGRFRALAALIATVALACGLSLAIKGAEPWRRFIALSFQLGTNSGVQGLFSRVGFTNFAPSGVLLHVLPGQSTLARALGLGLAAVTLALITWLAYKRRRIHDEVGFGLFVVMMLLVSPLLYVHHQVFLVLAALPWLRCAREAGWRATYCTLWVLLVAASQDFPRLRMPLADVYGLPADAAPNLWAITALFLVGLRIAWHRASSAARVLEKPNLVAAIDQP